MTLPPGFRPLDFDVRGHRSLIERAALRYGAVHRLGTFLMRRLPPGALRRLFLERIILPHSFGTLNRRDLHALGRLYFTPDCVLRFAGERIPGFPAQFNGRDEMEAAYGSYMDDWGVLERKPVAYAERGDLLIVLIRQRAHAAASGLDIEDEVGQVYRLRGGLTAEYAEYRSWAEAIAHAG